MPFDIEVVFGFRYENWIKLEVTLPSEEELDNEDFYDQLNTTKFGKIDVLLKKAHKASCVDMGFDYILTDGGYEHYRTPQGVRELVPFEFELYYDPSELGDKKEDAVLGVSISGRYFPTFIDWRSSCGTISNFVFGPVIPKEVEIAWRRIVEFVPFFIEAEWIIRHKFY